MKRSTIGVSLIWLAIWQLAYIGVGSELLLPSPIQTVSALGQMLITTDFYINVGVTFWRVLLGVAISMLLGVVNALGAYYIKWLEVFLSPLVTTLKVTPVMAIIVLALLWFKSATIPVFVCFLMCYPIAYTNTLTGLKTVDKQLLEMSRVFEVSKRKVLRQIYLPHIQPYLASALKLVVGLSWKVVIAAEVLAVPPYSMGYNLLSAKVYLESDQLFAWVIVIIVLSTLCETLVGRLMACQRGGAYDQH
ncbi:MAG: ABC transporter permease [Cellulosilyticaceae bacterium]